MWHTLSQMSAVPSPPLKTILVVDDSPTIRQLMRIYLMKLKVEIVEATDGQDALEKLRSQPVALIFSDVQMPKMDGFALLEAVRAEFGSLPFVMLTMQQDQGLRMKALAAGASALLDKPAKPEALLSLANSLLGLEQK